LDVVVPAEIARRLRGARRRVELAAGEGPERVEDEQGPLVDGTLPGSREAAKRLDGRGVAGPVAALQQIEGVPEPRLELELLVTQRKRQLDQLGGERQALGGRARSPWDRGAGTRG